MRRLSFNLSSETEKRRQLRAAMPRAEQLMWRRLRNEACGVKFRRQFSIGPYVLDFYCPQLRLALEIDGVSHEDEEAIAYDRERQRSIEARGVRFFRVTNDQVFNHMPDVMETLLGRIAELQTGSNLHEG